MATYNVGIIGLGRIAYQFEEDPLKEKPCTHAGAYKTQPQTKLTSICDVAKDKLTDFQKKWGNVNSYTNHEKMFKNEKLDIVSICTHTELHASLTMAAAEAGVKAIFCEKPISTNLREAEEMIKVCRKNDVILAVDHQRRWDNHYKKVKEHIAKGIIGDLRHIEGRSTVGLLNGGVHLFDVHRFFGGDVDWVQGALIPDETTDPGGFGELKFKNGVFGFMVSDWKEYLHFSIDLVGLNGIIRGGGGPVMTGRGFELWLPKESKAHTGIKELFPSDFNLPPHESPFLSAIDNIVDCIENGKVPECTGEDGKAALEIALAFHESERQKKRIKLPLENKSLTIKPRLTSFKPKRG